MDMNFEDYLIKSDISIIDAMKAIDKNTEGIVYACDDELCLLGALTDGDIRRHIIHGGDLNSPVSEIMTRKPIKLSVSERSQAGSCMEKHSITSVPIVNDDNIIQEIIFQDLSIRSSRSKINVPVVIMAGGKGTRLAPYTQVLPKPLIPIGEKTITEHIIDRFAEAGCDHFDIIVNYKKHLIKSYFRDVNLNVHTEFLEENEFLGTAGGLQLLHGRYDDSFFMTNCDILIEDDYASIMNYHKQNNNIITVVSAVKDTTIPYGVIDSMPNGRISAIREKPVISTIVNTGFYVLSPDFINMIPKDTFIHITDVIKDCINHKMNVGMYPIAGDHWMDMGQMDELQIMTARLQERI